MSWKWFRFLRVATTATLPTLSEASPAWAQDRKRLNVHDGTEWKELAYRTDRPVGEVFEMLLDKAASETFPALKLWESDQDISSTNWPLLVTDLRAEKVKSWNGTSYTTDHTVTVSTSTLTGSGTAWDNLLAALAEENLVHGSYTSWLSINVAGTDYAITNVNASAHTVTVTGTPTSGSQTAIVYAYRIAGSTTTARLRKISGRALISPDGTLRIAGARRRHHLQGHIHQQQGNTAGGSTTLSNAGASLAGNQTTDSYTLSPSTDGVNGTPITGPETEPNSAAVCLYLWGGRYVP